MATPSTMILLVLVSQAPARPLAIGDPFASTAHRIALETLVQAADVQASLGVDEAAKASLQLLRDERADQANRIRKLMELAPGAERSKLLVDAIAAPATAPREVNETVRQILGEEKFARLNQIRRQLIGPAVVVDSAEELGLTSDQRTQLLEISVAERSRPANRTNTLQELQRQQLAEVRKVLTANQQRILDDLFGPPSGVVSKEPMRATEFGLRRPPFSVWHSTQRSPIIYLGFPEVRRWLELANWTDLENILVEENDIEALVAYTTGRLPSGAAEPLADLALMTRSERMDRLEQAVYRLMSKERVKRLKNLKYQVFDSAPYSWPNADLLGVTEAQINAYVKGRRSARRENRIASFDRFQFLTPEQRKKWDELRGEPVPANLRELCAAVGDTRWRPQLREGSAAKLREE